MIEVVEKTVRLDPQRAAIFFETEDGLLILRYLLERVREHLHHPRV